MQVALVYACGCRWTGQVEALAGEAVEWRTVYPCLPEDCPTCQVDGMCATRQAMPPAYEPLHFEDIGPVRRGRYTRMKKAPS